jgi:flagellar M-ring protein FliF
MAELNDGLQNLMATWKQWSISKKAGVIASFLIGLAVMGGVAMLATTPTYGVLMTGLAPEDAEAISAELTSQGVPYRYTAGGTAIRVPADKINKLRMSLAKKGLPRGGGIGYELFDDASFGVSRFTEQINYRRGLEGELRRTIRSIDPVREARIHVVMPKKSLFMEQQTRTTASVSLELHPGRILSAGQIQAVVHLVASSVEGLSPDEVTVVDSRGNILSRAGVESGILSRELEHQREIERRLEGRVRQMLGRVVGPDEVSVRVNADVDFTRLERTVENFDPDGAALRSEQTNAELKGAAAAGVGGIPGARANLEGGPEESEDVGRNAANSKQEVKNYEISKDVTRQVTGAGAIKRITVAVLVNGTYTTAEGGVETFVPRDAEALQRIGELVKKAVGFDPMRGDQVEVQTMAFAKPVQLSVSGTNWTAVMDSVTPAIVALLLALAVYLAFRGSRNTVENNMMLQAPQRLKDLEAAMAPGKTVGALPPASQTMSMPDMNVEQPDPVMAAGVLKSWLRGEQ